MTSYTSSKWIEVSGANAGSNAMADVAGGVCNIVTGASDNDYHAIASSGESFLFLATKKLWFEARFRLTEATTNESAWWFGLTDTLTTGGFQADALGPLASYDGALIWKDEGTMLIDFETSNAASKATAAGSEPCWCLTISAPTRSAQWSSCSAAAARNVSAAASNTLLPCDFNCAASFAMVVVLPEPLTPATSMT